MPCQRSYCLRCIHRKPAEPPCTIIRIRPHPSNGNAMTRAKAHSTADQLAATFFGGYFSPASMRVFMMFCFGGSGQVVNSLNAHGGLYVRLRSMKKLSPGAGFFST